MRHRREYHSLLALCGAASSMLALAAGCGSAPAATPDAALERDASIVDSGASIDATAPVDASSLEPDGAAVDSGADVDASTAPSTIGVFVATG
ncbi:MAG: hypothetical protein M3Y87_17630, partial [Myxococcota bacterium]|nr:hypothetical protein [Myxococcota bacterium]